MQEKNPHFMNFRFTIPHNLVIVFCIIICAAILTWVIPGGRYERETVNVNGVERSVIVNGSFQHVESQPQTWQIFSAFYKGFINMSHIIVFILMVGGAFWIMNDTKAIDRVCRGYSKSLHGGNSPGAGQRAPLHRD